MVTKFESGEEVLVKGNKEIIDVAKKDFTTKKISYKLKSGRIVEEEAIKKLKGDKPDNSDESPLFKEYEELIGKPVPKNKKNDEAWIKAKIEKAKQEKGDKKDADKKALDAEKLEALKKLDFEGLVKVIKEKELEIDPEDYEKVEDLLTAVCEELNIEIPEK